VAAVGGRQAVLASQMDADARRDRFLTDRQVERSGNLTGLVGRKRRLLESPDACHGAVQIKLPLQIVGANGHGKSPRRERVADLRPVAARSACQVPDPRG